MPLVKPPTFGDAPRILIMNPLGEALCDFFLQALVLLGYMKNFKSYEVIVRDYFAVEVQCQYDGGHIVRVSLAENPQEVYLEVLDAAGTKIGSTMRIRLQLLYTRSATSTARLFYQRISLYLP